MPQLSFYENKFSMWPLCIKFNFVYDWYLIIHFIDVYIHIFINILGIQRISFMELLDYLMCLS